MGGYAGSSWSQTVQIRPGESRVLQVSLPTDGVERMVGTFLEIGGVHRDSQTAVLVRNLYYRLFHRTPILPGQFCAWSTNSLSSRVLIDRGLLATNQLRQLIFDSTLWKNANAEDRMAMARDLRQSAFLIGKSKYDILEMLGPGQAASDEGGFWLLGFLQLTPLDFPEKRLLRVQWNEAGQVTAVEIAVVL